MEILQAYWHQIIFGIGMVVVAVRLDSEVKSLRKDLDNLNKELDRRETYVETVKLRADTDMQSKQISSLWEFVNKINERTINK